MVCAPAPILSKGPARSGGSRAGDAFGFSGADGAESAMRNWCALMALPWAVAWAVQAELIEETLRRLGA